METTQTETDALIHVLLKPIFVVLGLPAQLLSLAVEMETLMEQKAVMMET